MLKLSTYQNWVTGSKLKIFKTQNIPKPVTALEEVLFETQHIPIKETAALLPHVGRARLPTVLGPYQ
jgi:hypothetical protein